MGEWQPIETAPAEKRIMLWWVGRHDERYPQGPAPPTAAFGTISAYEVGKVWSEGAYIPLDCYSHWQPLPEAPK